MATPPVATLDRVRALAQIAGDQLSVSRPELAHQTFPDPIRALALGPAGNLVGAQAADIVVLRVNPMVLLELDGGDGR
jgi:hypothetical protein